MNENEIQQRIRSARDILVGVVPDPKGQVDQITTALAYKFMADQDAKAVADGGKPTYFVGDYARFAWKNLMDAKIGGQERFDLYMRAIEAMAKNENLPPVFRQMFKGAFLPFRDLQVLHRFLKEIDDLHYENVADLGDAYEHLLGVMSSQGAAGQFRTPRHIVEFIVDIVDPQKSERIHDPACGTGGFLIAAFRRILAANTRKIVGDSLSAKEKRALTENIIGWDLDPGMTRLSIVNMYLHGITQPKIGEYDTLTNDDRWDDDFDVVLANPPYMTPTGGVRPHKRFSLRANRAEILFVDYIAEHLTPRGRAGVVVPEGVLFRADSAHKKLREYLVNNWGLWAIASLPPGVFNPYSGVKTSILFLDKLRAKTAREILLVKIENDGFDLGAQRRPIGDNDLPEAAKILTSWKGGKKQNSALALWVRKSKIAGSGDFSLAANSYRAVEDYSNLRWPMIRLGDIIRLDFGVRITKKTDLGTKHPVYGGGGESFRTDSFNRKDEYVISRFALSENCVRFVEGKFFLLDSGATFSLASAFLSTVHKDFIGNLLLGLQEKIYAMAIGAAQKNLNPEWFQSILIPLPPLEVQRRIVAELDGYQKVVDGARQLVDNWIPRIQFDSAWPKANLSEVATIVKIGVKIPKSHFLQSGKYPIVDQSKNRIAGYCDLDEAIIALKKPVVVFGDHTRAVKFVDFDFVAGADGIKILQCDDRLDSKFFYIALKNLSLVDLGYSRHFKQLKQAELPIPPMEEQRRIAAEITAEEEAVAAARRLLDSHERKIRDIVADIWGKNGETKE